MNIAGVKRSFQSMQDESALNNTPPRRSSLDPDTTSPVPRSRSKNGSDWPRTANFEPDASVVLVGVRGVGKSSLAVLAATAYSRRLIDTESEFLNAVGASAQAYRKVHGTTKYIQKHREFFTRILKANSKNCIIICSFSDLDNHGVAIMREYAQTNPVIHVTRDTKGIHSYLGVWTEERVVKIVQASGPILRACSSYEFFNLSESNMSNELANKATVDDKLKPGMFLALKRVERDFLKLLRTVIGEGSRMLHHSSYPLSGSPVHRRNFTFSAVAYVDELMDGIDLNQLQIGADAVELRIPVVDFEAMSEPEIEDYYARIAKAFAMLRRQSILPVISTVVSAKADHQSETKSRCQLTSYCLRLGPEYCSVDMTLGEAQIAMLLAARGRTKVIATHHTLVTPPEGWNDPNIMALFEKANQLEGCDAVRLTMPARSVYDNFACAGFREKTEARYHSTRLIAYNTGRKGKPSLVFNSVLTPVNHQHPKADRELDDDDHAHVTAQGILQALSKAWVFEPMRFYICGAHVSFSLSPAIHNAAYKACGLPHCYTHYSCNSVEDIKVLAYQDDFGGASVVQPWKTRVLPLLGGMSSHAKAIGAVNTVMPVRELMPDGSIPNVSMLMKCTNRHGPVKTLYGYNTDWIGIRACIRRGLSPANTVRPQSTGLVCGAGGQARSAIYSMLSLGVRHVFIVNRTTANAQALADHYNKLIEADAVEELFPGNAPHTRVRTLESFDTPWPAEFRHPSMIVSAIPTQASDGSSTNFRLNDDWLKSPTGGAVVEVRPDFNRSQELLPHIHSYTSLTTYPASLQTYGNRGCPTSPFGSLARLGPDGWLRCPARASLRPVRAVHRPKSAAKTDEGGSDEALHRGTVAAGSEREVSRSEPARELQTRMKLRRVLPIASV